MAKSIAIVLKGYPRLSETFIAQEIHAIEQVGVAVTIFSLRHPTDKKTHPVHDAIKAPVVYLPEYLYQQPGRVIRAWWKLRRSQTCKQARKTWWRDLKRDLSPNRVRRFGQALVLAAEVPGEIDLLYAHFLHTPASVTRYASIITQIPWSCSAHAKDIWTIADWEKREKLAHCRWLTTCTRTNLEHLQTLAKDPGKVVLNYHGLDISRFPEEPPDYSERDGSDPAQPVRILSVGRAVAKKGYRGLIDALAALPKVLHWEMTHIGGGPLLKTYKQQAKALGIADKINWIGAQSQQMVIEHYRRSDFFVLNCRIDPSGDRDGLPNVLVEAQSQGLAVISTDLSGIPELIEPGVNGSLVEPDNNQALTAALAELMTEPELRQRLGRAGLSVVLNRFDLDSNFVQLHRMIAAED